MRQIANAISPSNFVLTNPELLRETLTSNAENLVRGMHMLAEDIEAGGGDLQIRQSDAAMFEVGRNLATTPGKVIFQNDIMQLIQYAPSTATVLKRPLLIVPPWINKFYVLDLTPEKSFIKWCVDQGITVFCISWVNPDAHLARKSFEDYIREGPLAALDAIKQATGEDKVHAIGYCVGGTLLAVALAAMAARDDERIVSATFFAAQVDFTYAGDLKVFVDEEQVEPVEQRMAERGYLEGKSMVTVFNLLRSNDLIWPYIINNYLQGQGAVPVRPAVLEFRRHAAAGGQSFVLFAQLLSRQQAHQRRHDHRQHADRSENDQDPGLQSRRRARITSRRRSRCCSAANISAVRCASCCRGSGHIAGVVNPPDKHKYQYWTGRRAAQRQPRRLARQGDASIRARGGRTGSPGSSARTRPQVPARMPGDGALKADRGCAGKLREGAGVSSIGASPSLPTPYLLTETAPPARAPIVSGKPSIRFMFCTACPDAPLVRLSSAEPMMARPAIAVGGDADEGHVGAAHVPGLRQRAERQHVHERLVRVRL